MPSTLSEDTPSARLVPPSHSLEACRGLSSAPEAAPKLIEAGSSSLNSRLTCHFCKSQEHCKKKFGEHVTADSMHRPEHRSSLQPPLDDAVAAVQDPSVLLVGLVELYPESWCVLQLLLMLPMPDSCICPGEADDEHPLRHDGHQHQSRIQL